MKDIKGINIPKLGFLPQKLGDLIYHEGPLLSLFIDKNNPDSYYLYKWADCNDKMNRWLVFQLNAVSLKSFFYKQVSLRNLLLNIPFTYIVGIDDNLNEVEIMICATNELPESYLPKENSFYKEENYTEFAQTFKTIIADNSIYDILHQILNEVTLLKKQLSKTG